MKRQRPSVTSLVAFLLIVAPVVYMLSYAPVVRMYGGGSYPKDQFLGPGDLPIVADGSQLRLFWPVDWLIDETPLHDPLFAWADMWGVRLEFEVGESIRQIAELPIEPELQARFDELFGGEFASPTAHDGPQSPASMPNRLAP